MTETKLTTIRLLPAMAKSIVSDCETIIQGREMVGLSKHWTETPRKWPCVKCIASRQSDHLDFVRRELDGPGALQHEMRADVRFSNRPFGVKHFQAIHHCSVDVAHGLALLFGIGTPARDIIPPLGEVRVSSYRI